MKFKYEKTTKVMDEVELELPYYYEEIETADYRMFGKIDDEGCVEIGFLTGTKNKEVIIDTYPDPSSNIDYIRRYCLESTKEKFEAAKEEALDFLA